VNDIGPRPSCKEYAFAGHHTSSPAQGILHIMPMKMAGAHRKTPPSFLKQPLFPTL
jgi:hypothetical protein